MAARMVKSADSQNGGLDANNVSGDRYHSAQNDCDSQGQESILKDGVCTVHVVLYRIDPLPAPPTLFESIMKIALELTGGGIFCTAWGFSNDPELPPVSRI